MERRSSSSINSMSYETESSSTSNNKTWQALRGSVQQAIIEAQTNKFVAHRQQAFVNFLIDGNFPYDEAEDRTVSQLLLLLSSIALNHAESATNMGMVNEKLRMQSLKQLFKLLSTDPRAITMFAPTQEMIRRYNISDMLRSESQETKEFAEHFALFLVRKSKGKYVLDDLVQGDNWARD